MSEIDETEGKPQDGDTSAEPKKRNPVPNYEMTRFSSTNQPSGEAKSLGMWKKMKGRKLLRKILQHDFDGTKLDPKTRERVESQIKMEAAIYFNVPEAAITNETIMIFKQVFLAMERNDTAAFNSLMDRAYGKMVAGGGGDEDVGVLGSLIPQIIIQPIQYLDTPPIAQSEAEIEQVKTNETESENTTDGNEL